MPNKPKCSIYGCRSNAYRNEGMKFFSFPARDSPMYEAWLSKCAESTEQILGCFRPFVCSRHFQQANIRGKRLAPGTLPELFLKAPPEFAEEERLRIAEEAEQARIKKLVELITFEWVKRAMSHPNLACNCTVGSEIMQIAKTARNLLGANLYLQTEIHWVRNFRHFYLEKLKKEDFADCRDKSVKVKDIIQELSPGEKILGEEEIIALQRKEKVRLLEKLNKRRLNKAKKRPAMVIEEVHPKYIKAETESESSECYEIKSEVDSIENSLKAEDDFAECEPLVKNEVVIQSYQQALEHIKPLEDFALQQENYRLIGLLTTIEALLKDPKSDPQP